MSFIDGLKSFIDKAVTVTNVVAVGGIALLDEVLKQFAPAIKDLISEKLKKIVQKNFLNLLLFAAALLIGYFEFPSKTIATYIASIIILLILVLSVIRIIKLIKKNSVFIGCLFKSRFKLFDTIVLYVAKTKGQAATIATGIISFLGKTIMWDETKRYFKRQIIKSAFGIVKIMIVDLIFLAIYMIGVSIIIKPMLLKSLSDLSTIQLYIYPFASSIDFLFHTNLCVFFGIVL